MSGAVESCRIILVLQCVTRRCGRIRIHSGLTVIFSGARTVASVDHLRQFRESRRFDGHEFRIGDQFPWLLSDFTLVERTPEVSNCPRSPPFRASRNASEPSPLGKRLIIFHRRRLRLGTVAFQRETSCTCAPASTSARRSPYSASPCCAYPAGSRRREYRQLCAAQIKLRSENAIVVLARAPHVGPGQGEPRTQRRGLAQRQGPCLGPRAGVEDVRSASKGAVALTK